METSLDKRYVGVGFSFLDSGLPQKVGAKALMVYLALRRFINRSDDGSLGVFHKKKILVCSRSLRDIATYCHLSTSDTHRAVTRLEKMKWVRKELFSGFKHNQNVYILGEFILKKDHEGTTKRYEMFFVDGMAEEVVSKMKKKTDDQPD